MSRIRGAAAGDLLHDGGAEGARAGRGAAARLRRAGGAGAARTRLATIAAAAPFRHMTTPGGYRHVGGDDQLRQRRLDHRPARLSLCRRAIPIDRHSRGRRCRRCSPRWPHARRRPAGFAGFAPDSCLINRYEPGARLTLHQDKNERDFAAADRLGLARPAGGFPVRRRLERGDRPRRLRLVSGDVVVWGGPARLVFHGIDPLADGVHPLTGRCRINLTFRTAL